MGRWNFPKGAGKSLLQGPDEAMSADLQEEIVSLGLIVDDIRVQVKGDRATLVGGIALSDEDTEKLIIAVGNMKGVAEVEAEVAREPNFCEVGAGDTLSKIAEQHLGSRDRTDDILYANSPMLNGPDAIYPGLVLRLPI